MDQSKFACPLNIKATKEFSALWRPRLKFTGAIAHGISEYYFISDGDFPKDPSTTCEQLNIVIEDAMHQLRMRGARWKVDADIEVAVPATAQAIPALKSISSTKQGKCIVLDCRPEPLTL
eukprot:13572160-Alexandrium_andersonii.AAC.1